MRNTWQRVAAAALLAAITYGAEVPTDASRIDGVFRYGFSECVDNTRTLFYYTDDQQTCSRDAVANGTVVSKPPVHGLRCDVVCDKGSFLGANFSGATPVSGCEKCPRGQYSLGGGKLFSKRTKAWSTPLPIDIRSECMSRNLFTNAWQTNCNPWKATADGTMIESGNNKNILDQFEAGRLFSSLRISATFVRNGTITFKYRVSAEPPSDGLVFGIDDQTKMEIVSRSDGWREAVYAVPAGAHTFIWDYTKDFNGDEGEDKAYIKVIELVGTSFSDTYCQPCGSDTTMTGGSLCAFCQINEYAAPRSDSELDFACYACPKNTFSPKGSIGLDACVGRRPCTSDDVVESFTKCVDGKRNVTFAWSEPRTCELELPGATALPAPKIDVGCDACEKGYRLTSDDTCEKCPVGERLVSGTTCEKCPAGKVVLNDLAYGRGTTTGWSEWPAIIDKSAAKQAGWKLTRDGLVFAPEALPRGVSSDATRFPLPFNVTFIHTGKMQIMYSLENVPTFETDGARAWLEVEVEDADAMVKIKKTQASSNDGKDDEDEDDDDRMDVDGDGVNEQVLHLANGGTNGTATEGFEFDITTPALKQFRLVLRTTNVQAARMVQAKLLFLRFEGTEEGAGVSCVTCAPGFQAIHSSEFTGCKMCPAGTFSTELDGLTVCEKCRANTWSVAGATTCAPCGANTFSNEGAKSCTPPTVLKVNSSSTNATDLALRYNIELMQSLVWGNSSMFGWDDAFDDDSDGAFDEMDTAGSAFQAGLVENGPVSPARAFQVGTLTTVLSGLFRPISIRWKQDIKGQVNDERVDTDADHPFILLFSLMNQKDAGGVFKQTTGRYGEVQCSVPPQWRVTSGGNVLALDPATNGTGVKVTYTGGSPCKKGRTVSTTLHFICDLKAGTPDRPTKSRLDDDGCTLDLEWRTAYACPICEPSFFNEAKTTCSGGTQSISYARKLPCYGGMQPESVPVTTCSDVVLDSQALYTAYAAISIVGFVILLLMIGIFIIHRKYRNAYNDYMYLKGKVPVSKDETTGESTFEFTPKSTAIHSSSPSDLELESPFPGSLDDETKEEDSGDHKRGIQSV